MNERIKQIAEQAGFKTETWRDLNGTPTTTIYKEALGGNNLVKFAELLIQDNIQTLINNGYDDAAKCLHDVHFGIEDAP